MTLLETQCTRLELLCNHLPMTVYRYHLLHLPKVLLLHGKQVYQLPGSPYHQWPCSCFPHFIIQWSLATRRCLQQTLVVQWTLVTMDYIQWPMDTCKCQAPHFKTAVWKEKNLSSVLLKMRKKRDKKKHLNFFFLLTTPSEISRTLRRVSPQDRKCYQNTECLQPLWIIGTNVPT